MPGASNRVSIQAEDFDLNDEVRKLRHGRGDVGAVVSFVGAVREWAPQARAQAQAPQASSALELEHYPGMTEACIEQMVDEAVRRFNLAAVRVVHRVGRLAVGDQIVLVIAASAHRHAAFQGCEFLMDWLKTQAPFWKKEITGGEGRWVDARVSDDEALARWGRFPSQAAVGTAPGQILDAT